VHGLVSLLDDEHSARVEEVWRDLEREFGLTGISITPFPHYSYQVAREYDPVELETRTRQIASDALPFTVRTCGLGVFTGRKPVLYLPVV
jgi:hypothetical protein